VAAAVGFDLTAGRIDTTTQPVLQYRRPRRLPDHDPVTCPNDFRTGLLACCTKSGHGLYEQNLPAEHFGTPAGEAASLALHESQARLWEITPSAAAVAFWEHFFPPARELFPEALEGRRAGRIPFRRQRGRADADPGPGPTR